MYSHLETNSILCNAQHGFRSSVNNIASCLNLGEQVDVLSFDFSKGAVLHAQLFHKLDYYGLRIRGAYLDWIREFLTNRTQQVVIDNKFSSPSPLISIVSQGMVLGPLLNYVPTSIDSVVKLYVDDVCYSGASTLLICYCRLVSLLPL